MIPNPNPSPELKEAITAAIGKADDAFGYSYRMTGLVDGVETHTLFMDGFEPVSFEDRDDGYEVIAERRNRMRTDAILAALSPPTPAETVTVALPGAGEVERIIAALQTEQDRLDGEDYIMDTADCIKVIREKFATVAAANDEGVALEAALSAMGWADERMIADARKIAGGFWFETYGYGGNCCLTVPQVASLRSCLDGARAAIRLLLQGGGK